ncbi:hypothetical protein EDD21DRAFT_86847, partial [Dissophora ornata]
MARQEMVLGQWRVSAVVLSHPSNTHPSGQFHRSHTQVEKPPRCQQEAPMVQNLIGKQHSAHTHTRTLSHHQTTLYSNHIMSSDQKRTVRDIFGDEDEDEDDLTHEDRNNSNDRDDRQDASFKDGAEEEDAEEDEDEENEGIALPSFKKRNADGGSPAPEPKKRKTVKKPKAAKGESQDAEGGDDLPLDPRQKALLQLEKDFELAMKSGRSKTRRHNKDEVDLENELDGSASKFAAKMREAAFADIDSKLKHQPALAKVRMLESVKQQLNK